jgi:hemerythrin-like metal-binding protein
MSAFIWNERFATGIALVDGQHRRLVELMNHFGDLSAQRTSVPAQQVKVAFVELADYAKTHFSEEEQLMAGRGLDQRFLARHFEQHRDFFAQVTQRQAALEETRGASPLPLTRFLVSWLAFHILGLDQQMARQLTHLQNGKSAAEAYALEVREDDRSAVLLLGAVDDLLTVVDERNERLENANVELERRVTERTRELSEANQRLEGLLARLKQTQLQLVESAKLASAGQLASGVAHEINNPLAFVASNVVSMGESAEALLGLLEFYSSKEALIPDAASRAALASARERADLDFVKTDLPNLLTETQAGLKRVQAIVQNLKDFTRVDESVGQEVSLNAALSACVNLLSAGQRRGAEFVFELGELPMVRCHGAQLNQAFLSLLLNAAQAVEDARRAPGRVTVRSGVEGSGVWVEVADDGVGMSDEVQRHLYEPFFTTRPPGQGLGLGLSVVYSAVKGHGGRLEVQSALGRGTTMRLWLPTQRAPVEEARAQAANPYNTRRYSPT